MTEKTEMEGREGGGGVGGGGYKKYKMLTLVPLLLLKTFINPHTHYTYKKVSNNYLSSQRNSNV